MIRVFGTSSAEIQDTLRRLKKAVSQREPVTWQLQFNKKSTKFFTYEGRQIKCYAIYTMIGDEQVELGFMECETANFIERNSPELKPIYRGGDIIVKGTKDGKKIFCYEPLKVTKTDVLHNPQKVIEEINQVAASMLQEGIQVTMEQKLFGLGFEIIKK